MAADDARFHPAVGRGLARNCIHRKLTIMQVDGASFAPSYRTVICGLVTLPGPSDRYVRKKSCKIQ